MTLQLIDQSLWWLATVCFVICGIPQALDCYHRGNANGTNTLFIWLWFTGEASGVMASLLSDELNPALFVNYILGTVVTAIILYYKHFPRYPSWLSDQKTLKFRLSYPKMKKKKS